MKDLLVTYILWFFTGIWGGHRFYLGHIAWGIIYLLSGGLFFVGWFLDLFLIPHYVNKENRIYLRRQQENSFINQQNYQTSSLMNQPFKVESKETLVLKAAKKYNGKVTPIEVALESGLTIEEAQEILNGFLKKGYIEQQVTSSGVIIFVFTGFLKESERNNIENF